MLHIELLILKDSYEDLFEKFRDNFLKKIVQKSV